MKRRGKEAAAALLRRNGTFNTTVLLLLALVAVGPSARADTLLIDDLTDTITISQNGNVVDTCPPVLIGGVSVESNCEFNQVPVPLGTISNLPIGITYFFIDEGNGHVSDVLALEVTQPFTVGGVVQQGLFVDFGTGICSGQVCSSGDFDNGIGVVDLCSSHPGGCAFTETGGPQLAMTVNWTSGATLAVSFESDTDASTVPEPSSLMLFATGLIALGKVKRKFSSAEANTSRQSPGLVRLQFVIHQCLPPVLNHHKFLAVALHQREAKPAAVGRHRQVRRSG